MLGLSIRSLLMGLFAIMVAVVLGLGAFAVAKIATAHENTVDIATNWLPSVSDLRALEYQAARYRIDEARHVLSSERAAMDEVERDMQERVAGIKRLRAAYEPLISSPDEKSTYESLGRHWDAYFKIDGTLIKLSRGNQNDEAAKLYKVDAGNAFNAFESDLEKLVDINMGGAAEATKSAAATYSTARMATFVFIGIGAAIAIGAMVFVLIGVARPLLALVAGMKRLGEGDFAVVLPGLGRKDEIGAMAGAVEQFKVKAEERAREEAEAKSERERAAAIQRKADMTKLADEFESAVGEIVGTVSSASTELEASATTLTKTAETSQELATTVASASEEASTNVQSVASATEELTASVSEIGRQVQESNRISSEAVEQARKTDDRMASFRRPPTASAT
jgi:methyl-accepting chemotaxis protein